VTRFADLLLTFYYCNFYWCNVTKSSYTLVCCNISVFNMFPVLR